MATINSISGSSRIKDTYTTIYNNDNSLNVDLIALEDRVDNIVSQAGDDNTEIVDARQSAVYGETFATLDGRLENHEADTGALDVHGLLTDGKIIEETGSNANGKYVRFSDGTQIAYRKIASSDFDFTALAQDFAYPASFISGITGWGVIRLSGTGDSESLYKAAAQSFIYGYTTVNWRKITPSFLQTTDVSSITAEESQLIAIGRWK